jgi:hypothetical protein
VDKEKEKEGNQLRWIEEDADESNEDSLNIDGLLSNTKASPEFDFFY